MNKWLKFLIILFILIGATILPLVVWLKTDSAKEQIGALAEKIINEQLGVELKISGLDLSLPLIVKVENATLYEQEKVIIAIKDLYINIVPSLLSFFEVSIKTVSIEELHILGIPNIKLKAKDSDEGGAFFNPNILVEQANIAKIILAKSLTNQEEIITSFASSLKFDSFKKILDFTIVNKFLASGMPYMQGDNALEIHGFYGIKNDILDITYLRLQSDIAKVNGSFVMDASKDHISGEFQYHSNILGQVLTEKFKNTTSQLDGNVKISGTLTMPEIQNSGNLAIDFPQNDYFKFLPLSWDSKFLVSGANIDGAISLVQAGVTSTGNLGYKNKQLYLQNFKATAPGFEKTVNLTFNPINSILKGQVVVNDKNLQTSAKTLPFLQGGALALTMTYSSPDNKTQHLNTNGQIKHLRTKLGNCDLIDLDLNMNDLWNLKLSPSNLAFTALNVNDLTLRHVALNAYSNKESVYLDGAVINNQPYPMDIKFATILSFAKDLFSINISDLSGAINSIPIKNSTNIIFKSNKNIDFKVNNLIVGDGSINSSIELTDKIIKANADLQNIPLSILPSFLPQSFTNASVKGSINLSGSRKKPNLKSNLDINNITIENSSANTLDLKTIANITNNQTNISGEFFEKTQKIADLSMTVPSKFSLIPFEYNIYNQKPIAADLSIIKGFDLLSMIPVPEGSNLVGKAQGDIKLTGNLDSPIISGNIKVNDGQYKYTQYGVLLKNITTEITASGQQILFNKIIAKDRFNNQIKASGSVALDREKNFNLDVQTDKFDAMNTPYLQGKIQGKLNIKGDKNSAISTGDIFLGPMEIKIPEHFQAEIPELHIVETIKPNDIIELYEKPYQLQLDIALTTAKKVYVRGWGVDTQLKGGLQVTGYAHAPLINGSLKSVHGKYKEFGKSLVVKEGVLMFDGPIPPSPYLNIIGVYNVGSNEIRLILSGSIQNPDVSIESTPSMEQEEALSMLLFGTNTTSSSPFQALQLAAGVRRLSGHGGGFDPLGLGRKALRVDNLDFKNDSQNPQDTTVSAGKYFSEKVYVELETGQQEGSAKTKIEVQITPKISIEGIAEQDGNNSVGVNWKFDY